MTMVTAGCTNKACEIRSHSTRKIAGFHIRSERPGVPTDTQRGPAKFQNAPQRAKNSTSDSQRSKSTRSNAPNVQGIDPVFMEQIPITISLNDLPAAAAELPGLQGLKYIRVADRIVFVDSASRKVMGEIRITRQSR